MLVRKDPSDWEALYRQGVALASLSKPEEAVRRFRTLLDVKVGEDEKSAIMTCDLLLVPNVPAPQDAVDEELRDACGDAINSVRKTLGVN